MLYHTLPYIRTVLFEYCLSRRRRLTPRQPQQLSLTALLQKLLPHKHTIRLTPLLELLHLHHLLLLLRRRPENLTLRQLRQQRIQNLALLLVPDIDAVRRLCSVRDERVARVRCARGRGVGGAALGVQGGHGGVGRAVRRVGGGFREDVEEGGAFCGVVAGDFDGDAGVAVFYSGEHFAPEFPGVRC